MDRGEIAAAAVRPAVGGFVDTHLFEVQVVAIFVAIDRIEQFEGDACKVLGGWHAVKYHGLVARHAGKKIGNRRVTAIDQEGVIPDIHDMAHGDGLDLGKVHHHAVIRLAGGLDDFTDETDFQRITMPVQMTALALVIGYAMAGIELEAAGDLHGNGGNLEARDYSPATSAMPPASGRLSVQDHRRDSAGMTYVYPVVSRRAGGVSVGINLNPNNACNWHCIYCQVPNLKRGGPPPIDMVVLEGELHAMLVQLYEGDFLERHAPPEARRVVDIAFSGNGEPTSAAEFPDAVACVCNMLETRTFGPAGPPRLRLITNGSMLGREAVRRGIANIGKHGGEVWFKVDAVGSAAMRRINGVALQPETVLRRLLQCAALCETWVQTCWFALDGAPPTVAAVDDYLDLLFKARGSLGGVHLYGLARPSLQPEALRLSALPADWLEQQADRIEKKTGLPVRVSP